MTRITADAAAVLKQVPSASDFYLFVQSSAYIWTGRVDAVGSYGKGLSVQFTTLSGDRSRLLPGLTAWVGSSDPTDDGKSKGYCRLIANSLGDQQHILLSPMMLNPSNKSGSQTISVGDIISVDLIPRYFSINSYHDYGDIFPNHTDPPFCNMGPHRAAWVNEPIPFWAFRSWAQMGKSISQINWGFDQHCHVTFPNNDPHFAGYYDNPVMVSWDAPGDYIVTCQVLDSAGVMHQGYRIVMVRDHNELPYSTNRPYTNFKVDRLQGAYSDNGWNADFTLYGLADTTTFSDSAVVVLRARDIYNGISYKWGGLNGYEDTVFVGQIATTTTSTTGADDKTVKITASTPGAFAKELHLWPANFAPSSSPTAQHNYSGWRLRQIAHHLMNEHSTVGWWSDIYAGPDLEAIRVDYLDIPENNLLEQLNTEVLGGRFATAQTSRYGEWYLSTDANMRMPESRAVYGPVEIVFDNTWWTSFDLGQEYTRDRVAQIDATGAWINWTQAPSAQNIQSVQLLWPAAETSYGNIEKMDGVLICQPDLTSATTELTRLAIVRFAMKNLRYPQVTLKTWNVRGWDPALQPYVGVKLAATDTQRGYVWSWKEFIVRGADYKISEDGGVEITYNLEESIWGEKGLAGQYPTTSRGPDWTNLYTPNILATDLPTDLLATTGSRIIQATNLWTGLATWTDVSANAIPQLGLVSPAYMGVERNPIFPDRYWHAYGRFGIIATNDGGGWWYWKKSAADFSAWLRANSYNITAEEMSDFAIIRHHTPPQPSGFHAALATTKYPGVTGRYKLWLMTTYDDWQSINNIALVTDWIAPPGGTYPPMYAQVTAHPWPYRTARYPTRHFIWIASNYYGNTNIPTLWGSRDRGLTVQMLLNNPIGNDNTIPWSRVISPEYNNDNAGTLYLVPHWGTNYWKMSGAQSYSSLSWTFTKQTGATFGMNMDMPLTLAGPDESIRYAIGNSNFAGMDVSQGIFTWQHIPTPGMYYRGFAVDRNNPDVIAIGCAIPTVGTNNGLVYISKNGGGTWSDISTGIVGSWGTSSIWSMSFNPIPQLSY